MESSLLDYERPRAYTSARASKDGSSENILGQSENWKILLTER